MQANFAAETVLTPDILVVGDGDRAVQAARAAACAGADVLLVQQAPARRAGMHGVDVLQATVWGAFPGPEIAAVAPGKRVLIRPRRLVLVQPASDAAATTCVLHGGIEAGTTLTRALGAAHQVVEGRLETIVDAEGRTSLPFLSVIPPALAPLPSPPRLQDLPGETLICPCEGVTADQIRQSSATTLAAIKRATRAGMGPCGGRSCLAAVARYAGAAVQEDFAAPRMPLWPIKAAAIMAAHPEPEDLAVPLPPPTRWLTTAPAGLPENAGILVIGGGIVGLATALFLARAGHDVLLADRGEPGHAASTANAGSLHVQLVPYVYAKGGGPMADALTLGPQSVALWQQIARDGNESLGLRIEGGLILAETPEDLALLRAKTEFERSRAVPSEVIGPADLAHLAPGLDRSFAGAAFCPLEGQGDPLRGTAVLLALARQAGVRIVPGLDVTGLAQGGAAWCVATPAGTLRAGQVVNAAGAQAGRVAALAGVTLPMHALVQQVIATEPAPPMLRQLVAWTGRHLSLKQTETGHLLIGGGWPGTIDAAGATHATRTSIEGNLALAARALPGLAALRVTRAWTGLAPHLNRPPVISATPGQPGLWHAVSGNGYTLGPVMGQMIAEAISGGHALPLAFAL